ncbi:MAG TPA: response regulator [Myxococcaceae bacterium]|nr:response regulator [Myxococcaceae bacterium]
MADAAERKSKRILVVDDDSDWRELLLDCLDELGYATLEASNGQDALECVARDAPSVMLLDMRMPGMSGEEVLRRLPAENAPRVVVLTAARADEAGGALRTGPHYYLPKGATREELALLLESLED